MAINGRGDSVVLLQEDGRLQADYRVAGEMFGEPQPLTPASTGVVRTLPASIAIDPQGNATVAMHVWHLREASVPRELEVSESNTTGVFPNPTVIEGQQPGDDAELMAGAHGETALFTYTEEAAPNQPLWNEPFATRMRLSSEGGIFGAPQAIEAGLTGWESGCGHQEPIGTASVPSRSTLASRPSRKPRRAASYALQASHEQICPWEARLQRYVLQIQHSTDANGISKPISVPLPSQPTPGITPTVNPQPASALEIGQAGQVHIGTRGYLQSTLACGAPQGHSCQITIILTIAGEPPQNLTEHHIKLKAFSHKPLRIKLAPQFRAKIDSAGQLATTITISTLGEDAPPTVSEYPLTILPPLPRHAPRHKTHPRRRHKHRPHRQ